MNINSPQNMYKTNLNQFKSFAQNGFSSKYIQNTSDNSNFTLSWSSLSPAKIEKDDRHLNTPTMVQSLLEDSTILLDLIKQRKVAHENKSDSECVDLDQAFKFETVLFTHARILPAEDDRPELTPQSFTLGEVVLFARSWLKF